MREYHISKLYVFFTIIKLLLILAVIIFLASGVGAFSLNIIKFWQRIFSQDIQCWQILIQLRLPRILLAIIIGGGLSLAGLCLQILLQNPLAEPYTLGISGGATIGASIASLISLNYFLLSIPIQVIFALIGAFIIIFILYLFIKSITYQFSYSLLMLGIILNAISSAFIMLIFSVFSSSQLFAAIHWMMGHIPTLSLAEVLILFILVLSGLILIYRDANSINALLLGEENAESLGINVSYLRKKLFIISGFLTAITISFTGMIGFIGLITPHISKLLWGADNRIVIPASFMTGGIILLIGDTIARTILMPKEIPVGVITALVGGPYFIYLLTKQMR
jgi:iron complex transport system permease protein